MKETMSTLPSKIDLGALYSPPIFDQLDLSSCVENALCLAIALQAKEYGQTIAPLARMAIYYDARIAQGMSASSEGSLARFAIPEAISRGITSEAVAAQAGEPYTAKADNPTLYQTAPTAAMVADAALHKVTGAVPEFAYDYGDSYQALHNKIEGFLLQGKPVMMGLTLPAWFSSQVLYADSSGTTQVGYIKNATSYTQMAALEQAGQAGIYKAVNNAHPTTDGHELLIVGLDDSLFSGQGGYIVANSWGTEQGVNGYFVIPYDLSSYGIVTPTNGQTHFASFDVINGFNGIDQTWTAERGQVAMMYASALNRAGENSGFNFYVDALHNGVQLNTLTEMLVNSAEGQALYSSGGVAMTTHDFINKVYSDIRGRVATTAEMTSGQNLMQLGTSRGQWLYGVMLDTQNGLNGTTTAEHDRFVNRSNVSEYFGVTARADDNHLQAAVTSLQGVTSNADTVEIAIIGLQNALHHA